MLVTEQFLVDFNVCSETTNLIRTNELIDKEVTEVLRFLRDIGVAEPTVWWNDVKKTEQYVRLNGSIFTMTTKYQVFNPLTGNHTQYETEEEAKQGLIEVAQQIIANSPPAVVQEMINENGDSTWMPTDLANTISVIV
jgi:hypothetical protein